MLVYAAAVSVFVNHGGALSSQTKVDLFKLPGVKADTRFNLGGHAIETVRMSVNAVEGRLYQFKKFLVVHVAGRTQHNSLWMVTTV